MLLTPFIIGSPPTLQANTMNLTRFETQDGIELVVDTRTGEAFATQRGYARMSGRDASTISRRCAKLNESGIVKNSEIDTGYGIKVVALIPADLVYDWMCEDNLRLAKVMGKTGATVYIHQLAGFKVSSTATVVPQEPKPLQLPPADVRVSNLINALKTIGFDMENPRFNQGIKDITGDILGLGQSALKPATGETWCGVAERAEQLGHPVGEVARKRSQLGKWVAQADLSKKQESRLCNGTQRSVNLYLVGDELDSSINGFFRKV